MAASSSGPGAWSPPIASRAIRRMEPKQRPTSALLRVLRLFDLLHLLALVLAALQADLVRGLGGAAVGALGHVRDGDARHPLGPPRIAPRRRLPTLLNRHDVLLNFHVLERRPSIISGRRRACACAFVEVRAARGAQTFARFFAGMRDREGEEQLLAQHLLEIDLV